MAALDAAFALEEVRGAAVRVAEDLELDVAAAFEQLLQIDGVVGERGRGEAPPLGQRRRPGPRSGRRATSPCRLRRRKP